jgi:DNA-binding phage protein
MLPIESGRVLSYEDALGRSSFDAWFANERSSDMALTRDFKATVFARVQKDPEFRSALLVEAAQALIDGEPDITKSVLRDYINATIGFEQLSQEVHIPKKSIMRMLSQSGNPTTQNMALILACLNEHEGLRLKVSC